MNYNIEEENTSGEPIRGYKMFDEDFTNMCGAKFELGKTYELPVTKEKPIHFGTRGYGFHFCERFEDTLRYFNPEKNNILTEVIGSGKMLDVIDDYYGSGVMHVSSKIEIVKILSREEILKLATRLTTSKLNIQRVRRFIQFFPLTPEEFDFFNNWLPDYYRLESKIKSK